MRICDHQRASGQTVVFCEPPTTSIRSIWQNNLVCKELVAVQTSQHNSPLNIHQGSNMFIQKSTLKAICLIRSAGPILPNSEILGTSKKTKFIALLLECGPKMLAFARIWNQKCKFSPSFNIKETCSMLMGHYYIVALLLNFSTELLLCES